MIFLTRSFSGNRIFQERFRGFSAKLRKDYLILRLLVKKCLKLHVLKKLNLGTFSLGFYDFMITLFV